MKHWLAVVTLLASAAFPAGAATLEEALARAYATNPELEAARARLRSTDEGVARALAGFRPTVVVGADITRQRQVSHLNSGRDVSSTETTRAVDLVAQQPIWRGGILSAQLRQAEADVLSARGQLAVTEQRVLLNMAEAYTAVLEAQASLQRAIENERILEEFARAARRRFQDNEVTKTDVAQAETRLAAAQAFRLRAEADLEQARALYWRVAGEMPENLTFPESLPPLPESRDAAIATALDVHPLLAAGEADVAAAEAAAEAAFGELLPNVVLQAAAERAYYGNDGTLGSAEDMSLTLRVSVPLYEGGAIQARVRQLKQVVSQRRLTLADTRRRVEESVITSWDGLAAVRAQVKALEQQVENAVLSLESVRIEHLAGSRTVIDVLNAERELLEARLALIQAQRSRIVLSYRLLSAMGHLQVPVLELPVEPFDPKRYYEANRGRLWGTSIEEPGRPAAAP